MSIEKLVILIGVVLIILATLDIISMDWFCGIALLLIAMSFIFDSDLKSEPIIEEYLRSSYETTINKEDISDILNSYDKNAKLIGFKVNTIPNSKSIYLELEIRKGKLLYLDIENNYTIGLDNDKVFINKEK